jgi:hypothetical protein
MQVTLAMDAKLGADMAAADMVAVACRAVDAAPWHMSVESHTEGVFLRVAFLPPWAPLVAPWVHPLVPQEDFKVETPAVLSCTMPPQQ